MRTCMLGVPLAVSEGLLCPSQIVHIVSGDQRHWRYPRCKHESRFFCKAVKAADFSLSNLEAQLSQKWPAWTQNACRRISQGKTGQVAEGPTPREAAVILTRIAKAVQNQGPDAYARQSLGGGREVKGLMEALQVTAPRASSSGHMPGLASNSASGYPSVHAMADLTAADASQGIWAAAILGGSAMYEPETDGLIQVGEAQGWQCLTAHDVANACWGLATARHSTAALDHMMHAGLQAVAPHTWLLPEGVARMKARQVTALLWGCAVLLHQPTAVLTNLATVIQSTTGLAKYNCRQLAACAWALSVLQQQAHPLFHLLSTELLQRRKAEFTKHTLMQLHQVNLEAKASGLQLQSEDRQGLLKTANRVWDAEAFSKRNKQRSYYAKDIVDTVIGLGIQYKEEDTSSGYAVDVGLLRLKIAIEADGPSHRSRNTRQLLGSTVMKQRHVRHAGWQLLTVAHDDWDELRGRQQKLTFLQTRIDLLR
ncbi:hypothetical protein ABBQ32_003436 [Trebouxia sp. C0010 RCD-2024]